MPKPKAKENEFPNLDLKAKRMKDVRKKEVGIIISRSAIEKHINTNIILAIMVEHSQVGSLMEIKL